MFNYATGYPQDKFNYILLKITTYAIRRFVMIYKHYFPHPPF